MHQIGKADFFDEFIYCGYDYNIIKFFGCYGYILGIAVVILFAFFVASIQFVSIKSQGEMKAAAHVAAITLAGRTVASVLDIFGIVIFYELSTTILSLSSSGYVVAGAVIGLMFATDKEKLLKNNKVIQSEKVLHIESVNVIDNAR